MLTRVAVGIVVFAGCSEKRREAPPVPPTPIAVPRDASIDTPIDAAIDAPLRAAANPCATHDVELVYAIDDGNTLYSFDPTKLPGDPFRKIGTIECGLANPNSMAVDHSGIAWVSDHDGQLYRVSILDAQCALAGRITGDAAPREFGMGFVSNGKRTPTNTSETLFVASSTGVRDEAGPATLGTIDPATLAYRPVATLAAQGRWNPEFSGTGDGVLYGYFPMPGSGGFVQEVGRTGKAIGKRFDVPTTGEVRSYAFAVWGGVFYVFAGIGGRGHVYAIHRASGKHETVRDDLDFRIVGAGVSTCAPILEAP